MTNVWIKQEGKWVGKVVRAYEGIFVDNVEDIKMENPCPVKFFEDALSDVILELQDLLIRKQKDYGHKNISEFGEYGILVRSNDKLARLKNLMGKTEEVGVPQNEPIVDSWTDLAGYAILALMWRRGVFLLPLKPLPEQRGQTPGGISGVGSGSTVGLGW